MSSEAYQRFCSRVADEQLAAWLPAEPSLVLDVGGSATRVAARGHRVVGLNQPHGDGVLPVCADGQLSGWLRTASVDAVVAEEGVLSSCLATERTLEDLHRVLRPGGRLLLCVESLVHGLAALAERSRWAELADAPSADVVLVPRDDGGATRCFGSEELVGCLRGAGFGVEWVRPRTVLGEQAVDRALAVDPGALGVLVRTELRLAEQRAGDTTGAHLLASAVAL